MTIFKFFKHSKKTERKKNIIKKSRTRGPTDAHTLADAHVDGKFFFFSVFLVSSFQFFVSKLRLYQQKSVVEKVQKVSKASFPKTPGGVFSF